MLRVSISTLFIMLASSVHAQEISLKFNQQDLITLSEALSELSYKKAAPLMQKLQIQIQQQQTQQQTQPENDKKDNK